MTDQHAPWVDGLTIGRVLRETAASSAIGTRFASPGSGFDATTRVRPPGRRRGPGVDRDGVRARRPFRRLVDQPARVGAPAIRGGPRRRGPGEDQPVLPTGRGEVRPGPVGGSRPGPDRTIQGLRLLRDHRRRSARNWRLDPGDLQSAALPTCDGSSRCGARRPPGMLAWETDPAGPGDPARGPGRARGPAPARRADQPHVHLRHDRAAPGGSALAPELAAERILCRREHAARRARQDLHPGPALPLFRVRPGHAGLGRLRHAMVFPNEYFQPEATLDAIEQERCTIVYGVPTMFIAELEHETYPGPRPQLAPDGDHGREPLPDRADAAGDDRDGGPRDHDRLRPDRGLAR